jgi:N utilization substance protein B
MSIRVSPKKRHKARKFALQGVYQWQLTGNDVGEIVLTFLKDMNPKKTDTDYFRLLMRGVPAHVSELDESFTPFLDRPIKDIGPIELAILRLGAYELIHCPDLPYKVAVNEAVELAKDFGPEESFKYMNGVLDKVAKQVRSLEANANKTDA